MNNEARLNKIESAVQAIPRTAEQLRRESARMQDGGIEYGRWLRGLSDTELLSLADDSLTDEERQLFDQLTDEELETVAGGDYAPLERLRNQQGQA